MTNTIELNGTGYGKPTHQLCITSITQGRESNLIIYGKKPNLELIANRISNHVYVERELVRIECRDELGKTIVTYVRASDVCLAVITPCVQDEDDE